MQQISSVTLNPPPDWYLGDFFWLILKCRYLSLDRQADRIEIAAKNLNIKDIKEEIELSNIFPLTR